MREGTRFTIHGKGPQQDPNLPPGDLFVRIRYRPNFEYGKENNNLIGILEVDYLDAIIGASVNVRHISGRMLSVTIPPDTQPNALLRLRGEGFTDPQSSIVGDFIIRVQVTPPEKLSDEHKRLLQRIQQERRRNN